METAYSDEPFLIVPEVKALSSHSLRILNSSVEVRPPMKSLNRSTISQLAGCTMYKDSVANECYAIQVHVHTYLIFMEKYSIEIWPVK